MINFPDIGKLDTRFIINILRVLKEEITEIKGNPKAIDEQIKALEAIEKIKAGGSNNDKVYLVALLIQASEELVKLQNQLETLTGKKLH